MRSQQSLPFALIVAVAALLGATQVMAATVAQEDFDGGDVNLISSSVTNLDGGGGGDWFGVAELGAWPQGSGAPFSLTDDSVSDVSGGGAFPADTEGTFGQNRDTSDAFFGLSDTREWNQTQRTASWTFDISGYQDLELCIDMGAQANADFDGFPSDTLVTFSYQIDAGPVGTAFTVAPNSNTGGFTYRAMDSGAVASFGSFGPLHATGDNPIAKILSDSGLVADNTFLNKTPASGAGAGLMDTFSTALSGKGGQLTLTMVANMPLEAMAVDNIAIKGEVVPEPASAMLVGLGSPALLARRRSAQRARSV